MQIVAAAGLAGLLMAAGLAGCSSLQPMDQEVKPVIGPAPRLNMTPMSDALACIRDHIPRRARNLRIGVSDFVDGTGVMEGGSQYSHAITQRPDLMLIVALAAAGAHLVNRSSVNVAEWELKNAMEKKLGDGHAEQIDNAKVQYRPVRAGVILGSTHYVTGAVTELNWNISSGVAEAGAYSAGIGRRTYRISIAVDVMVTDTQTTEIEFAKSYKKQLVGFELNANFFRFFSQDSLPQMTALSNAASVASSLTQAFELFNANLGEKQNEPSQVALRWVIELAAYEIMRDLTHAGPSCDGLVPPSALEPANEPAAATDRVATVNHRAKGAPSPASEAAVKPAPDVVPDMGRTVEAAHTNQATFATRFVGIPWMSHGAIAGFAVDPIRSENKAGPDAATNNSGAEAATTEADQHEHVSASSASAAKAAEHLLGRGYAEQTTPGLQSAESFNRKRGMTGSAALRGAEFSPTGLAQATGDTGASQ